MHTVPKKFSQTKLLRAASVALAAVTIALPLAAVAAEEIRLRIDAGNNILDLNGRILGHVVDASPNSLSLTIDAVGHIIDGAGREVGQIGVAEVATPPANVLVTPRDVTDMKDVAVTSELGSHLPALSGSPQKVVLVDDIAYRRHELFTRIDHRVSEGRLSANAAVELRAMLDDIKPMEEAMRATGGLDFKESRKLYLAFDKVANEIDHLSAKGKHFPESPF